MMRVTTEPEAWTAREAIACIEDFERNWRGKAWVPGDILLKHLRAKQAIRDAFQRERRDDDEQ